ncbi:MULTISPECIES: site-specific integrase, partial [unclassified Aurantimonas]|uniref:site-specific integrase n=1 Tax=unclassified Aurantimonas TaxID=2638230 RepID=UPI002E19D4EE
AVGIIGGEKLVRALDTADVISLRDALQRLPSNYTKLAATKGMTVLEAISSGGPVISPKTQDKYFSMFRSFLRWAYDEELIEKVPGEKVKITGVGPKGRDGRDPYSVEQLKTIFSSPLYAGHLGSQRHKAGPEVIRDGKFWVPLIALYSGMRMGEIVQLLISDIKQEKDVWFFDISKGEEKSLKTAGSARRVPIHDVLLKGGLLDLLADKPGTHRVFSDVEKGKDGYFSHNFSKWWGRYSRQVGFKTPKTAFHSFRHNFTDAVYAAEAPERLAMALLGHADKKVHSHYGSGPKIDELHAVIDKVEYPIDLSFLMS